MICWLFISLLFSLHIFEFLIVFFSCSWHLILPHCDQKRCLTWFQFFKNLPRVDLWPRMWSILENVLCALVKKVKFIALGWNVLYISIRSNWSILSFEVCVSLLIFCLVDLSIGVSGGIKVSHYYCVTVIFPFHTCYICFTCGVLLCWVLIKSHFNAPLTSVFLSVY